MSIALEGAKELAMATFNTNTFANDLSLDRVEALVVWAFHNQDILFPGQMHVLYDMRRRTVLRLDLLPVHLEVLACVEEEMWCEQGTDDDVDYCAQGEFGWVR